MCRNTVVSTCLLALILMFAQLAQAADGDDVGTGSPKKTCPNPLPANVQEKLVKCPDGTVATISVISMGQGFESTCEDTYLYCNGQLKVNIFNGCARKAVCWEAVGAQAKVWHVQALGPTPPAARK